MTTWFRSSETDPMQQSISVKEAVKSLVAPPALEQDRNRFSPLLLEHGEHLLQDWAVIATSSSVASSNDDTKSGSSKASITGLSKGTEWNKSGRTKKKRVVPNRSLANSSSASTKELSATCSMIKMEGRLHLCSRSIVFEPMDPARGIVRCPFNRMKEPPIGSSGSSSGGRSLSRSADLSVSTFSSGFEPIDSPLTIDFVVTRHMVIKENNIVGPFSTVQTPTQFSFVFMHSSPDRFVELCVELHKMVKQTDYGAQALEEIRKPMFHRPFDPSNLVDIREKAVTSNLQCSLVTPLQSKPGTAIVTTSRLYFQPAAGVLTPTETIAVNWPLESITSIARRYSGLKDCALEVYFADNSSVLLALEKQREREKIVKALPSGLCCHTDREFVLEAVREWKHGNLSNYEYLLAINSAAGRTFHDLSRYPVFPWVIADYSSEKLDLYSRSTFRDLTKPMGALNEERLKYFQRRIEGMVDMDEPFLYGTHYSAPGYILYYLVRSMPEHMLCLQNGKFDAPDRMFYSIQNCYSCALTSHADVKELIPEFYNPSGGFDFLINARNLQLGATQRGDRVNDVALPPWARSPRDFLKKNRKALESDVCTQMLPAWIDLIFGAKSRGEEALDCNNLFHPSAYFGPADLDRMETFEERTHTELQAIEFGIVPDQLFARAHPSRRESPDDFGFVSQHLGKVEHVTESDGLTEGDSTKQGEQAWELLESPTTEEKDSGIQPQLSQRTLKTRPEKLGSVVSPESSTANRAQDALATPGAKAKASWVSSKDLSIPPNDTFVDDRTDGVPGISYRDERDTVIHQGTARSKHPSDRRSVRGSNIPLSGAGSASSKVASKTVFGTKPTVRSHELQNSPSPKTAASTPQVQPPTGTWDMKRVEHKLIHNDTITGCNILLQPGYGNTSLLSTVSLDGSMLVSTVAISDSSSSEEEFNLRGLTGTLSRFTYLGLTQQPTTQSKIKAYRTHTASDPLACMSVTSDGAGGQLVFAGGHDDVVLAYGISSACAVASVYSHRDAVTGLDLLSRPQKSPFDKSLWTDQTTHIMVSGSWDATVKVWSVAVASGETVSINREPLAELFDADSTIVCLSALYVERTGVAIATGCSDGSFVAWLCHDDGTKVVIHKEPPRKGGGPCAAVKWGKENGCIYLFTAFSTGKVASYLLQNGCLTRISAVSVGVGVLSLAYTDELLLVGCSDGGLRLLPLRDGAQFNGKPVLWPEVNGKSSPGLTCLDVSFTTTSSLGEPKCVCVSGADDGSVAVFELTKVDTLI